MPLSARAAFYRNNLLLPLLLAAIVFVAFDLTELDRWISNLLIDPATGQFPLLHDQWFEKVTHKWPRVLPNWTGELAGTDRPFADALRDDGGATLARFDRSILARHAATWISGASADHSTS